MAQIKITWTKSCIGRPQNQRRVIDSLGLRRLHHSVVLGDTPTIRGMVNKVQHLVSVEELREESRPTRRPARRSRRAAEGEAPDQAAAR